MRIVYSCLACRNLTTGENPVCTKDHQLWRYRSQDERLLAAYPQDTCFDYIPAAACLDSSGATSPATEDANEQAAVPDSTMCYWHTAEEEFDEDGFGPFRGAFNAFAITVAFFGLFFLTAELNGALSVNAKVGLAGLFIAACAGFRSWHLYRTWRDWKGYLVILVPAAMTFIVSIVAWGW